MVIKQAEVNVTLKNKLSEEDIEVSSNCAKRSFLRNNLLFDIASKRLCDICPELKSNLFTLPEGNVNTEIMFVMDPPSEYDGNTHTTMFDADGRLITVVLDKLGLKRDNIYITHINKCFSEDSNVPFICGSKFLMKEISIIKPKMLITLGGTAMNVVRAILLNEDKNLDVETVRRKIFTAVIEDTKIHIVHTISPAVVLSKRGALYNKFKLDLWNDIYGAYKSINK